MARLKAIISCEYDADPDTYGEGVQLTAEAMASLDQMHLSCNPEIMLSREKLKVRVKVVAE